MTSTPTSSYMNVAADVSPSSLFADEDISTPHSIAAPELTPAQKARNYCLLVLLLPLLAIPACIRLGASDFFQRHGASVWVQSNDQVFDIHDRPCDVLIYGDSTAITGINPDVVERNTGLKTCNIAVTNSVLAVAGNLTLDRYLEHNPKPRVLLIQLSPDGFQPESYSWEQSVYAEGLVELLRHGSPAENRRVLLNHPRESIAFAGYAAGFTAYAVLKDIVFHTTHMRPEQDRVSIHNGFFTPPAPASTTCEPGAVFSNPRQSGNFPQALVQEFQQRYSGRSGVVLVNVAPIPSCDQNLAAFSSELNGITSNSLTPLPVSLFNDPRHYTAVGSAVVSRMVAKQVDTAAERNPELAGHVPSQPMPNSLASLERVRLPR